MTRLAVWSRLLGLVLALVTVAALTASGTGEPAATPDLELAADTSQFEAGNIISDAVFFDPTTMTDAEISAFLKAKGASCRRGADGSPCLKDFRQDTTTKAADGICDGTYAGAPGEWASQIILKVARACGVNPQVLLVLLQKEMGFLTATNPTAKMYERAAGYACPDNVGGRCDPTYAGLQNQLYRSAWQYQRYAAYPQNYAYRAGRANTIQWDVEASCGTSSVYIQNQATAGLYNYTPYRPNAAALAAGYGPSTNSCAAYGNRNFWLYFTDWFGSTQSRGGDAILAAHAERGGATGPLGPAAGSVRCGLVFGGCVQNYRSGSIYWSPASGARAVLNGPIADAWAARQWERSLLGYPVTDTRCGLAGGGCLQSFQTGTLYWNGATGAHTVSPGPLMDAWAARGWEGGALGYPVGEPACGLTGGGCVQNFQTASIAWSPGTGAHPVSGSVAEVWGRYRWEQGQLGYPSGDQTCGLTGGACLQAFQRGTVYVTPAGGTHAVLAGPVADAWAAQRWESGPLGYPASAQTCGLTDAGCLQSFTGGTVYWTRDTGAHPVLPGPIADAWATQRWESGPLGYPTGSRTCGLTGGGCLQSFENGTYYTTAATGTHAVLAGPIADAWATQRWESGPLGYPTGDQVCDQADRCRQTFTGGTLYSTPATGAHAVTTGPIATAWTAQGAETGPLGYPTSGRTCGLTGGGCLQAFERGTYYTTNASGTHAVLAGPIADAWAAQRWETGPLGYPTADARETPEGLVQDFAGGQLLLDRTTGQVTRR
ncbi:LGFP repeat-containing protein [Geodermatophilus amargosae]|uniref:LGFP repeat-containing protein n=1 Tax=Geodermatophilus amargosae TaxID=1296565 RepID=UPI0034DED350